MKREQNNEGIFENVKEPHSYLKISCFDTLKIGLYDLAVAGFLHSSNNTAMEDGCGLFEMVYKPIYDE